MELNVVHVIMYAHPTVNGSRFCVSSHTDNIYGTVEQTVSIDDQEAIDTINKYGIHHYKAVDSDKCDIDGLKYYHDLWVDNGKIISILVDARNECEDVAAILSAMESNGLPDVDKNAKIVSVPLSDVEYEWWRQTKRTKFEDADDKALEFLKIVSRGMSTTRVDLATIRTDDTIGNNIWRMMTDDSGKSAKEAKQHGRSANAEFEAALSSTGIVDPGYEIWPLSTGIIHAADMWEVFLADKKYLIEMGKVTKEIEIIDIDSDGMTEGYSAKAENAAYQAELQWVSSIAPNHYNWEYWRKQAWNNKRPETNTYFRFLYRVQVITDAYMINADVERCPHMDDYPKVLDCQIDAGEGVTEEELVVDGFYPNRGRTLSVITSDWFNYIYELHCIKYELEYDDFWVDGDITGNEQD